MSSTFLPLLNLLKPPSSSSHFRLHKLKSHFNLTTLRLSLLPSSTKTQNATIQRITTQKWVTTGALLGAGVALALANPVAAAELPLLGSSSVHLNEPSNALSLPTWAIHVSSVVEWIIAMALVWQYGDKPGNEAWKGLTWGMIPLLGGAMCACTWHFFYNAESLEVLVALQAALTFFGNATICIAAFRIYKSQNRPENL